MFKDIKYLHIGRGVEIHPEAKIFGLEKLIIGDYSYVGPDVKICGGGIVEIGDYSKIHDRCFLFSKQIIKLGHISWIAQNAHLDGTGDLIAGNFLGVGHNSVLYSHMRHGDELEGYKMGKDGRLLIGDDVCFSGTCFVCPVNIEDKSLALVGAVITRNMKKNKIYAGNPAIDVTEKLRRQPYVEVSLEEKFTRMNKYLEYYVNNINPAFDKDAVSFVESFPKQLDNRTYYNLATRQYTKTHTPEEIEFNKWIFGYRAKFIPC